MSDSKIILITGSNSGLGRTIAEDLAGRGHTVFASMRQVEGKNAEAASALRAWAEARRAPLHVVELDISDDASVTRAVQQVLTTAGRIDVVINNAAVGALGLLEGYTPDQLHEIFDVNVAGVQRVNRAVLPHMRERRSGLLVHVSSTGGRLTYPAMGPYCVSKYALEALAELYRYELAPTGVDAIIVQPGGYPTDFLVKAMAPADAERARGYGSNIELPRIIMDAFAALMAQAEPPRPQDLADTIAGLIDMPVGTRPLRTVVDRFGGAGPAAINEVAATVVAGLLQGLGLSALLAPRP